MSDKLLPYARILDRMFEVGRFRSVDRKVKDDFASFNGTLLPSEKDDWRVQIYLNEIDGEVYLTRFAIWARSKLGDGPLSSPWFLELAGIETLGSDSSLSDIKVLLDCPGDLILFWFRLYDDLAEDMRFPRLFTPY